MNTSAEVTLLFGDGPHTFKLGIKQIDELQRLGNAGIGEIAMRVMSGKPYYQDIRETIRLGLIGAGMPPVNALRVVEQYVDDVPINRVTDPSSPLKTAMAILQAKFFGLDELAAEEAGTGTDAGESASVGEVGLTSQRSTRKVRSSGGRRKRSGQ